MNIISQKEFITDPKTGWVNYQVSQIESLDKAQGIYNQAVVQARVQRVKAVGLFILTPLVSAALIVVIFSVSQIFSATFTGVIVLGSLWGYALMAVETMGTTLLKDATKKVSYSVWTSFMKYVVSDAKNHWKYANHLYAQAEDAQLKITELSK